MWEIDPNSKGHVVSNKDSRDQIVHYPMRFADSKNKAKKNYEPAYNNAKNSARDNYQHPYIDSFFENAMADEIAEGASKILRGAIAPFKRFVNADVTLEVEDSALGDEEAVSAEASKNESGKKYEKTTAKPTTTQRTKLPTKVSQNKKDKATKIPPCLTKSGKPIDDGDLKKVLDFVDAVKSAEKVVGSSKT